MTDYVLVGEISKEIIRYRGKVITHTNKDEMEWIFTGVKVIQCPSFITEMERIHLRQMPDFESYKWPLKKSDFRR